MYFTTSIQFCHMGSAGLKHKDTEDYVLSSPLLLEKGTVHTISSDTIQQFQVYTHAA